MFDRIIQFASDFIGLKMRYVPPARSRDNLKDGNMDVINLRLGSSNVDHFLNVLGVLRVFSRF